MMATQLNGEPLRARAVFSTEDFGLMKEAVGELIRTLPEEDRRISRLSALYHRLGRLD